MSNFFRKDLNLSTKWGHRLLVVIFFGSFIYCLFSVSKYAIFEGGIDSIYEIQSGLQERLTSEVKSAKELSKHGEILDSGAYGVNMFFFWWIGDGIYQSINSPIQNARLEELFCSNKLYDQLDDVIKRTGISTFYVTEINNFLEPVSTKTTTEYIKNNGVKCIMIDGFGGENKFLNPGRVAQSYQDYYFYKKSNISFLLNALSILSGIIMISIGLSILFSLPILLYYKVILYVIYGSNKNDKTR